MSLDLRGATMRRYLMILLGAATVVAPERAVAQAATSTSVSVRSRTPSASRDSLRTRRERLLIRFDSLRNEYEHERMSVEEREALAREMRQTMLALQESFGDVSVEVRAFGAARAGGAEMQDHGMFIAKRRSATRGYLGVSFDGPNVDEMRGNERIIRFLDYPRIALVEPSSPAERAGIVEGDTLLELNGTDVRDRAISLTRMLVPQQRVRMRVRRDGNPREFRVTVAEAPGYVMSRAAPMPPMVMATPMPSTAPTPPARVRVYAGDVPQPMMAPPAVAATPGSSIAMTWVMQDGVAGARLETIGEGLGRALGTRYGVLVLRAAPGTPAFDSGLRDGDVILKVAGESVRSVRDLREAMQDADEDVGVKLVVLRDKKSREITLRWQ